jgi:porphobilinogen synthase
VQQATQLIKEVAPDMVVIADLCFCEYTAHGHCGVLTADGLDVDNDATLPLLVKQALSLAKAGVDIIAPSGMMDHMVHALRQGLDAQGYQHLPIMSYAVKFASHYYGPFREAAEGAPQFGDRRSYQMDIANASVALREAELDIQEGADFLIIKPAGHYLDIIYQVKAAYPYLPVVGYQVSGEYAAIKAAAGCGWLSEQDAVMESLIAIKRSGADLIISYFAKDVAASLNTTSTGK